MPHVTRILNAIQQGDPKGAEELLPLVAESSPRTIFSEALERTEPVERARYLDQACAGDPALRERMEKLLQAHDEAGGFLYRRCSSRRTRWHQA